MKCKTTPAVVLVRSGEPMCSACLDAAVMSKFKAAKGKGIIMAQDRVLVAVSGGSGSMATLTCMLHFQSKTAGRPERGKVAMDVGVIHIEEGSAHGLTAEQLTQHRSDVEGAIRAAGYEGPVHFVPLHEVFYGSASEEEKREKLKQLLQGVPDMTGREDLALYLRQALLLHWASSHGFHKVACGDCASTLAVKVVAEAAKGRGYGLPGGIQYLDSRHGPRAPAFIYPLRDVSAKELAFVCHARGIPDVQLPVLPPTNAKDSINQLAEGFVGSIQGHLPSIMFTILKTASNLQAFAWNDPYAASGPGPKGAGKASGGRGQGAPAPAAADQQQQQTDECSSSHASPAAAAGAPLWQPLCSICSAPLAREEQQVAEEAAQQLRSRAAAGCSGNSGTGAGGDAQLLACSCCNSCRGQILGPVAAKAGAGAGSGLLHGLPVPDVIQQRLDAFVAYGAAGGAASEQAGAQKEC